VLLLANVSVPPFFVDGLTTPVTPALKPAAPLVPVPLELLPPGELDVLLEHAARVSPAASAHAAIASVLRLVMSARLLSESGPGLARPRIERVAQPITE
jgi:hypothetical protein